jgi:tRNA(fMet)-specific endonuclease VapC
MVCLDTDIIVNFLRNERSAVAMLQKLKEKGHPLKTTTINSFELWKGAFRKKKVDGKKAVEECLMDLEIMNLDKSSSKKAAEIFESLISKGEMIDALDVMIAAIAISNNEKILTKNKKHFERIKELRLIELE